MWGRGEPADTNVALRAGLASSMLVGLVTGRQIIGVPLLAEAIIDQLVEIAGAAIQKILVR